MPATAAPPPDLKAKLRAIDADLATLRTDRAELIRERDTAKAAFAAVPGYDTDSPEFQRAEKAALALAAKENDIAKAQQAQVGVLRLMGQEQDSGGGFGAGEAPSGASSTTSPCAPWMTRPAATCSCRPCSRRSSSACWRTALSSCAVKG